jgi:multiple sugar transport system substrate-binding protein
MEGACELLKKWMAVTAAAVVSVGVLAGCGSGNSATNDNQAGGNGQGGSVNLTLGMWSSSPAEKQLVENQLKAFEQANPNIHVKVEVVTGDYLQTMQPRLASHTAPDVFYVDASYAPQLESSGVLLPLDDYIQKDHVDIQDFSPSLLKAFQWQGKTYGLPKDANSLAIEYNKDLLAKAGIHTPPATWEDFEKDAALLKAKGITPLSMPIDVARYYPIVLDWGGSFYDANNNKATFNDPSNQAGVQFFIDNFHKGYIKTPKDLGADWAGPPFAQGQVAMVAEGAWIIPALQQTAKGLHYGVTDFFTHDGKSANMLYTVSYSIAKSTKHPDEAAKLLFYLTGKDAQKMTAESGLAIPSRQSEQGDFLQKYPDYKAFVDGLKGGTPYQFGTLGQNFVDAINKATEAGVLQNQSAADVLKQADQTLQTQTQ